MPNTTGARAPTNIAHTLKGMHFPAHKADLAARARDNGADRAVLDKIESMPDGEFHTMADVMKAYGKTA